MENSTENISILYIEDDIALAFVTKEALERQGYQVTHTSCGINAIELFLKGKYQICLIDVLLPDIDGYTLVKLIRTSNVTVPVLFISGKQDDLDRLEGYKSGGDDYITKPYSIEELIYKIEIFYKRSHDRYFGNESFKKNCIGDMILEPENYSLFHANKKIKLTSMETALLGLLIRNKNRLMKRSEILVVIWGSSDDKSSRSLDVFISRLRKYLKADHKIRLESHKGVGYKLSELI